MLKEKKYLVYGSYIYQYFQTIYVDAKWARLYADVLTIKFVFMVSVAQLFFLLKVEQGDTIYF